MATVTGEPKGLGGWLALVVIGLFLFPIKVVILLNNDVLPIFQNGSWEILTTPGSEVYHYLWAPLIIFEIVGNIFFLIFDIILIVLYFKKSYRFPILCIVFIVLNFLFLASDFFLTHYLVGVIPGLTVEGNTEFIKELVRVVIVAIIWVPYFLVSKRVKNTFVKPEIIPPLPTDDMVIPEVDVDERF